MVFKKGHKFYKGGEKGWFKEGHKLNQGKKLTEEHKKKLSEAKIKNPTNYWLGKKRTAFKWKNHKIGYHGLHNRIKKIVPKPDNCQDCGKKKRLCLVNISGNYLEEKNDWKYSCYKCHYKLDRSRKSIVVKINNHCELNETTR